MPVLSTRGVLPSLWKRLNVVPSGKVPAAIVMSKLSVPLPVLRTMFVNITIPP